MGLSHSFHSFHSKKINKMPDLTRDNFREILIHICRDPNNFKFILNLRLVNKMFRDLIDSIPKEFFIIHRNAIGASIKDDLVEYKSKNNNFCLQNHFVLHIDLLIEESNFVKLLEECNGVNWHTLFDSDRARLTKYFAHWMCHKLSMSHRALQIRNKLKMVRYVDHKDHIKLARSQIFIMIHDHVQSKYLQSIDCKDLFTFRKIDDKEIHRHEHKPIHWANHWPQDCDYDILECIYGKKLLHELLQIEYIKCG